MSYYMAKSCRGEKIETKKKNGNYQWNNWNITIHAKFICKHFLSILAGPVRH